MTGDVITEIDCICDVCAASAKGRVLKGIAFRPPPGWFVLGRVALGDEFVGSVEQWFYCSETCAQMG